jgi:uncharacterized protein YbdZ (MbtH family)
MNMDENEDKTIYNVVVNHEEQYSIWPAYKENPQSFYHTIRQRLITLSKNLSR